MLSNVPFFVIDVGYVQGMNDILSRFLIVLGSEAEAYRCFVNYMETVKSDFHDDGMLDKISKFSCCTPRIMAVIASSRFQNSKALRTELRGLVLKTVVLLSFLLLWGSQLLKEIGDRQKGSSYCTLFSAGSKIK